MEVFLFSVLIWASSLNPNLANQANANKMVFYDANYSYLMPNAFAENNCIECHDKIMEQKRKHKPATEGCDKCHTPNGKEHPKEGVKGFSFTKEMPALCFSCHEMKTRKNLHQPSKDGKCIDCHSPHSSKNKKLLTEKRSVNLCKKCHQLEIKEGDVVHNPVKGGRCHKCHDPHQSDFDSFLKNDMPGLCYRCHDKVAEEMKLKRVHTAAKENCLGCHNPHNAKESYLLPDTIPNLCYTCHADIKTKKNIHKPAGDGKCSSCHATHGSKYKKLLTEKKSVNLCKECHQLDIKEEDVIHNPVKGGRCHKCHDPHQSDFDSFLKNDMPGLCYRCHDKVAEEMKLKRVHTAAKENCLGCHNPHNAKESYLLPDTIPNLCYTCHADIKTKKNIHKPAGDGKCSSCHATHGSKNKKLLTQKKSVNLCKECHQLDIKEEDVIHNPVKGGRCHKCHDAHQSDFDSFLKNDMPDLCFRCHDGVAEAIKSDNVHAPAKENCFKCHDPHSAKESYLLPDSIPNLCYSCHEDFQKKLENTPLVHQALNEKQSCAICHSSHGSVEKKLLKAKEKDLCLNCHNKTYKTESGIIANIKQQLEKSEFIHGPVNEGCDICHDPHASKNPNLLVKNFPVGSYAPANLSSFALCFNCHKSDIIELERSKTVTNFRDGDRNMHFLHTNGNRGRNCTTCHDMHASKNEHLIEDKVQYGNWKMPMKYVKLENGGSCFPGCHSEEKYDRSK